MNILGAKPASCWAAGTVFSATGASATALGIAENKTCAKAIPRKTRRPCCADNEADETFHSILDARDTIRDWHHEK